jgi:hypothetical protein
LNLRLFIPILIQTLFCFPSRGQETPRDTLRHESPAPAVLFSDEESAAGIDDLLEQCSLTVAQPIDLNSATAEDLSQLPFLSAGDVRSLLRYRYQYGAFRSRYELYLVPGLERQCVQLLLPFITLKAPAESSTRQNKLPIHQEFAAAANRCLNKAKGYRDATAERKAANKAYLGDPWHEKVQYQITAGKGFSGGFSVEKDAGEQRRHCFPWVGDSFNGYLAYQRKRGVVRQLIAGDYRLMLGCGLLLNQQFSLGKSSLTSQLLAQSTRLTPHASTEEFKYLQGGAIDLRLRGRLRLLPFASLRPIDGIVSQGVLTSLSTDGLHQLQRQEERRHVARLGIYGLHASWNADRWEIGGNVLYSHFNLPYRRTQRYYNAHAFRGTQLTQGSIDYHYLGERIESKGEVALSDNGAMAMVHLLKGAWGERGHYLCLLRSFAHRYQQLWGNTFSESSDLQSERGIYLQSTWELTSHWATTVSADLFRLTRPKYGIPCASGGFEGQARAEYTSGAWSAVVRYRLKHKAAKNNSQHEGTLQRYYLHSADLIVSYTPASWLLLRTQIQERIYTRQWVAPHSGFGVTQRITLRREGFPLSGHLWGSWFDTDNYDTRLYLPDVSLRYSYSSAMVYGEGVRYGAMLSYKVTPRCTVEGKYTLCNYKGRLHLGSDLQEIPGNTRQDVWMQCRWHF